MAGPLRALEALVAEMPNGSEPVRVVSRFASDVPTELAALVKAAAPSCVLLDAATAGYETVQAAVTGRLITVARPDLTGSPIVVPYDNSVSATAAVQVGVRIASLRREPLLLVGGVRAKRLARQLAGLGVEVRVMPSKAAAQIPPGALVIGAGGQLLVRAEQAPGVVDWASSVVPSRVGPRDAALR